MATGHGIIACCSLAYLVTNGKGSAMIFVAQIHNMLIILTLCMQHCSGSSGIWLVITSCQKRLRCWGCGNASSVARVRPCPRRSVPLTTGLALTEAVVAFYILGWVWIFWLIATGTDLLSPSFRNATDATEIRLAAAVGRPPRVLNARARHRPGPL